MVEWVVLGEDLGVDLEVVEGSMVEVMAGGGEEGDLGEEVV